MIKDQIVQQRFIRFVLFFFTSIWLLLIVTPCFNFSFFNYYYPFQKQLFSTVCHQNEYKSFICNDIPFLVCARCTGIYAGALIASLTLIVNFKEFIFKTKYFFLLSAPMLLDVVLLNFEVYNYYKPLSAFTGLLFGSSVFLYILSAIENLLFSKQIIKNEQK